MDATEASDSFVRRVATAIYIRAMHFHRRIDNASVILSARPKIKSTCITEPAKRDETKLNSDSSELIPVS